METKNFKIDYNGSIFWLIFWIIVFFPIALTLLFTGSTFRMGDTEYAIEYGGSRFWLCFWVLIFFPIAFLLLFLNGCSVHTKTL
jgi:hypothetical protein